MQHQIEGREIKFHLALPLTVREKDLKMEKGLESLIGEFEKNSRDTITFNQLDNKLLHRSIR